MRPGSSFIRCSAYAQAEHTHESRKTESPEARNRSRNPPMFAVSESRLELSHGELIAFDLGARVVGMAPRLICAHWMTTALHSAGLDFTIRVLVIEHHKSRKAKNKPRVLAAGFGMFPFAFRSRVAKYTQRPERKCGKCFLRK